MQRTLQLREQKELSHWLGGRHDFQLLYKASRDGCSNTAFHQKCNNKGPTVTVFYNTSDCTFGGYTAVSWDSSAYKVDPTAFLFRLYYKASWSPKKYPITKPQYAIHGNDGYGPVFGAGHDLRGFSGTVSQSGTFFPLNGTFNLGHSYNMLGDNADTVMCSSRDCYDVEVYSVKVHVIDDGNFLHQEPWRPVKDLKLKDLKSAIEAYAPMDGVKAKHANILLVGAVGAGKSSYLNTINSIFRGHMTSPACSGSAEKSLTTQYRQYKVISSETKKPLKVRLCDTRGLEEAEGLHADDIAAILDGNVPNFYTLNPSQAITPETPGYKENPTRDDSIHCVAIVMDCSSIDVFPGKVLQNIKVIKEKANERGIPQVILLTKVDMACHLVEDDPSSLFYSDAICEHVDKISQLVGLPRIHVLPVKNYEKEMDLVESVDILALISLRQILRFADDYLNNFLED